MKERPILFSAPMVRVLLDGSKTQTRRICKPAQLYGLSHVIEVPDPQERGQVYNGSHFGDEEGDVQFACPYGGRGDRLWVREAFARIDGQTRPWIETDYRATYQHGDRLGDTLGIKKRWTPSIHMPRHASRITLEVTGVRVERLGDISEADAIAEGIKTIQVGGDGQVRWLNYMAPESKVAAFGDPRRSFWSLWEAINGRESYDANPWVWVISFKREQSA